MSHAALLAATIDNGLPINPPETLTITTIDNRTTTVIVPDKSPFILNALARNAVSNVLFDPQRPSDERLAEIVDAVKPYLHELTLLELAGRS